MGSMLTRRGFGKQAVICAGAVLAGFEQVLWPMLHLAGLQEWIKDPFSSGRQLGTVDFVNPRPLEMDAAQGTELDGRLYTDLAKLSPEEPVIPTEKFYIRTRVSRLLPDAKTWRLRMDGLVEKPRSRAIEELRSPAKPFGLHLMECAGNVPLVHFGMISVATWAGVPLAEILDSSGAKPQA